MPPPPPADRWLSAVLFGDGSALVLLADGRRWQVRRGGVARLWRPVAAALDRVTPESVADGAPGRRVAGRLAALAGGRPLFPAAGRNDDVTI